MSYVVHGGTRPCKVRKSKDKHNKFAARSFQKTQTKLHIRVPCVNLLKTAWFAIWPFEDTAFDFGDDHQLSRNWHSQGFTF